MLGSTVEQVATIAAVPRAVAQYLDAQRLPRRAVCWPALAGLDWQAQGVNMEGRSAIESDLIGVTGAFCAIAETATLMLLSGAATPATTSLLPETHIALLPPARIVATMEDAWGLLRAEGKPMPRAVNFVSGPSRTADIEQTVTLGAHGPYRVHIVMVAQTA
jgi:L-lactate dehydrogenase complex protein LldG